MFSIERSGYYAWIKRIPSKRSQANDALDKKIIHLFNNHKSRCGSPKITKDLKELGEPCNKNRVAKRMKHLSLRAKPKRKFRVTTDSKHNLPVAPNLLNRDFSATAPNQKYIGDITYIWTSLIYTETYATREIAKQNIFNYIETYYNRVRRHSYIGFIAPKKFEEQYKLAG